MNFSYKKKGGHFDVFGESGDYLCSVKQKSHNLWMAWTPPDRLGQHAGSKGAAVLAELWSQSLHKKP